MPELGRGGACVHRKYSGTAGDVPRAVADYYGELCAVVGTRRGRRGVGRKRRPRDGRAIPTPLVAQGRRSRSHYREGRRLPCQHRLIRRLRSDRWREDMHRRAS